MNPRNHKIAINQGQGNLKKTYQRRQESSQSQLSSNDDSLQKVQDRSKEGKKFENMYHRSKDNANQYEYSDQSDQSQVEQQDQEFEQSQLNDFNVHSNDKKYNQTKKPIKQLYQMQEEQQESQQDSSQFQFNEQEVKNRIRVDMKKIVNQGGNEKYDGLDQESQDQDSIDYIEQRIKKLQKDLEERLGKHQQPTSNSLKNNIPLNQKKMETSHKVSQEIQTFDKKNQGFSKKNQGNTKKVQPPLPKKQKLQAATVNPVSKTKQPIAQIVVAKSVEKNAPVQRQNQISKNAIPEKAGTIKKKQPNQSAQGRQNQNNINFIDHNIATSQQQKVNAKKADNKKQFEQMQRKIQQLTLQNKRLKLKTSQTQSLDIHSKKKKPNQDLQKLKQFSAAFNVQDSEKNQKIQQKLNKQIELLNVLQRLQSKLKASVKRNMAKLKKNSSTLQKGISSSLLHNY